MRQVQSAFAKEREFMSNVSHELLTPASILQSRFENMLQDPTLPEAHAQQIVESQRTLYRLRNTVRTLLLIANIENEQYLRDEAVRLVRDRGRGSRGAGRPPPAARHRPRNRPDRRRRAAPRQRQPAAHAAAQPALQRHQVQPRGRPAFRVRGRPAPTGGYSCGWKTTAPALPPKTCRFLFDRFRRFHANAPGAPEGYGLGLPIAQTIAGFHGATLRAESEVGRGTAFMLDFRTPVRPSGRIHAAFIRLAKLPSGH